MAKTKSGQKYENIDAYTKKDGTKVAAHRRSNPTTSTGAAKGGGKGAGSSKRR